MIDVLTALIAEYGPPPQRGDGEPPA